MPVWVVGSKRRDNCFGFHAVKQRILGRILRVPQPEVAVDLNYTRNDALHVRANAISSSIPEKAVWPQH